MVFDDGDSEDFMSVFIKGMKMPKSCTNCKYSYSEPILGIQRCKLTDLFIEDYSDDLPESCPLVELPQHHGELIDRSYLMAIYEDRFEKVVDRYGIDSSEAGILSGAMKLLMYQDVIIEVE